MINSLAKSLFGYEIGIKKLEKVLFNFIFVSENVVYSDFCSSSLCLLIKICRRRITYSLNIINGF